MSSSQPTVGGSLPTSTGGGPYVAAPPPIGYPTRDGSDYSHNPPALPVTRSKGDGFWKGCCAALCCCCVLDACF